MVIRIVITERIAFIDEEDEALGSKETISEHPRILEECSVRYVVNIQIECLDESNGLGAVRTVDKDLAVEIHLGEKTLLIENVSVTSVDRGELAQRRNEGITACIISLTRYSAGGKQSTIKETEIVVINVEIHQAAILVSVPADKLERLGPFLV